jgi:hypothetical protein
MKLVYLTESRLNFTVPMISMEETLKFQLHSCADLNYLSGTNALYYELACETVYPIAEGVTSALLTSFNTLGVLLFLLVPEIPGMGLTLQNPECFTVVTFL